MPQKRHGGARHTEAPKKHIKGIIELTRRATGYLPWPNEPQKDDIEIPTPQLHGALNGDEVEVELIGLAPARPGRRPGTTEGGQAPGRFQGKVVRVVARAKTEFVGTVEGTSIKPDDIRFYQPIKTRTSDVRVLADKEKVLVKLGGYEKGQFYGTVLEHLGRAGEHRTEMNAIVLERGFKTTFPPEVIREAVEYEKNHAQIIAEEIPKRADYRDTTTFTIDPADAKDFDDALSIEMLPDGTYEVGIHIADATFFCRPGTAIDDEAQRRGTSVYLVDATIPMLPHELSNNICSLRENEDRLAFSAVFRLDRNAEILERRFEKSVIRSNKRFTYEEAQAALDTAQGQYIEELGILRQLARIMRKAREREGAIDFGDNEVKFTLDPSGKPLRIIRKQRIETNLLIEEFMLLANREVALYVSQLAEKVPEKNYTFLYRIHDEPKADRIEELATFVRAVGYEFGKRGKGPSAKYSAKDIQKLLRQIEGRPEAALIRTATLRSMARAIYSTKNIGHFGLSFTYYTHFTSPIRRYPDMLAHRILESHLGGSPINRIEFTNLEKLCIAASEAEAKAVDAERESIRYKQVEYLLPKIGHIFEGVISGVTDWGLYVEEKESAAEGLVRVATIGGDFYNYSQKDYALVGARSKRKFTLGDRVKVKLTAADLAARQLDFELV